MYVVEHSHLVTQAGATGDGDGGQEKREEDENRRNSGKGMGAGTSTGTGTETPFQLKRHIDVAMKMLSLDPNLAKIHARLISNMPESIFWRNYFLRIAELREEIGFEPLCEDQSQVSPICDRASRPRLSADQFLSRRVARWILVSTIENMSFPCSPPSDESTLFLLFLLSHASLHTCAKLKSGLPNIEHCNRY